MRFWWVNQNQTHKQEQAGGYLWSPRRSKGGAYNQFYENMRAVAAGDPVFCYWGGALRAYGIVQGPYSEAPRPAEFGDGKPWSKDGYRVEVRFEPIEPPVFLKAHLEKVKPLLPSKYSPLNRETGDGLQGVYLAEIPDGLARLLLSFTEQADTIRVDGNEAALRADAPEVAEVASAVAATSGRPRKGQGFGLTPVERRAVELHAMALASSHYQRSGWTVVDVSKGHPYDLVCTRASEELRVEVKGTTGRGEMVLLSKNEVEHARNQKNVALFVVHGILLTKGSSPRATGGVVRLYEPWTPAAEALEPLAYAYTVPPSRT